MGWNYLSLFLFISNKFRVILKFTHLSLEIFVFSLLMLNNCCLQPLNIKTDAFQGNNKRYFLQKSFEPRAWLNWKEAETWTCTDFITSFFSSRNVIKMCWLQCGKNQRQGNYSSTLRFYFLKLFFFSPFQTQRSRQFVFIFSTKLHKINSLGGFSTQMSLRNF